MDMNIRTSTETHPGAWTEGTAPRTARRRLVFRRHAGTVAGIGLGAAGAVHLLWATGSSWPAKSRDELADLVVGVRPFPSNPMTMGVVAAIGVATGLVVAESRRHPEEVGADPSPAERAVRVATVAVPAVLAARGVGGLVASALELGDATAVFRHWDRRLYSPLCLALAALSAAATARLG